ncbi:MAG: ATP-binding protein [Anaerolineae bacterium]
MRLNTLRVHGFGKLRDVCLDFSPGVNLIVGENESGKSTLQQALVASLFGFYDYKTSGGASRVQQDAEARYRPWDPGAPYRCTVDYCLDDGSAYRIDRTFDGAKTQVSLRDTGIGEPLVPGRLEVSSRGAMQPVHQQQYIGMSKEVFSNSACVDQGKLRQLSSPTSLTEAVAKSLDSDEADVSAKAAIAALDEAFRKQVGIRAKSTALGVAKSQLDEAERQLAAWDRAIERLEASIREEAKRVQEREALQRRWTHLEAQRLRQRAQELAQLMAQLDELVARLAESEKERQELCAYAQFPVELRDRLLELRSELSRLGQHIEQLRERQAREADEVSAWRQSLAEAEAVADELQSLSSFPAEEEGRYRALSGDWIARVQRLRDAEAECNQAAAVPPAPAGPRMSPVMMGAAAAVALGLVLLGVFLNQVPLFLVLAVAALAVFVLLARRPGSASVAEVPVELVEELERATAGERESREALRAFLRQAGIESESLQAGMDAYERMLVGRRRLQEAEEQAERSRRELEALQAHDQELAQAEESERHSLAEFRELLARAGVVAEDREQGWEEYEAGVKKQRQLRALDETIRTDRRERELLLSGRTLESLEAEVREIERQLEALPQTISLAEEAELEHGDQEQLERQIQEADIAIAELRREIALGMPQGPARGELEEEVARLRAEVERLERFGKALQLASKEIAEAAKRARQDFVPRLNETMGKTLGLITGDRYTQIALELSDKEVAIKVTDPETLREVDVDHLSLGTVEQCYLCLRLAIAEVVSGTGESLPLLLDDPFVNADQPRLQRMLEFLRKLGRERQVLFFTKDWSIVEWFQKDGEGPESLKVITLPATSSAKASGLEGAAPMSQEVAGGGL